MSHVRRNLREAIDRLTTPVDEHPHALRCRRWREFNKLPANEPFNPDFMRPEPDEAWQPS